MTVEEQEQEFVPESVEEFDEKPLEQEEQQEMDDFEPLSFWLVCTDGEKLLGYVGSQTVMDESDMMNVAVLPEARRQGIAERLILALVEKLKEKGSRCLSLEVRASNEPAIKLYQNLGFQPAGRRPNYYRNPKEDALILRKEWEL